MNTGSPRFLNIQTVFKNEKERTVENLRTFYNDQHGLLNIIANLSKEVFTEESIKGKRILLKPNWVKHSSVSEDNICLRTHDGFLLAVLEFILRKKPSYVLIGDAPIQGCKWKEVLNTELVKKIDDLAHAFSIPVLIKDFRRVIYDSHNNEIQYDANPISEYVIFDVGRKSFLEPITEKDKNLFRVSQYNPDKFCETHGPGMHKYCITKEMFNADVIISLPKIKTHQKSGITGALKNIVGFNGDKDYLPHHRIGGSKSGGDSYPGNNILRFWSELSLDSANRNIGKFSYRFWRRLSSLLWKISFPPKTVQLNGAWYGNDTTWRMVMDLNLIINFGKADGTISDKPQRYLYNFCDGIIGGQGDGPLKPQPIELGVISFSNESAITDLCMAKLMGINTDRIPLLVAASTFTVGKQVNIHLNGKKTKIEELKRYALNATMPPGWTGCYDK